MESDILVHILDGREKPTNLPFILLKNITGNFSEDRVVGQGGFAIVYKGVLPNGGIAVKRIRNNHSIDEKLFYREVDSLLTINHQNVVRFLGFCASTEQTAIKIEGLRQHIYAEIRERLLCFEYISNGSLKNHITDELRGLEWNTRYQIIKGICEGLYHLHKEKHIYHMDLKPANILLDNQMRPKITDFGLSRLDEKSETMSEDRCGSLGYCAPEYLLNGKMSFKSDMFSLGIVIIELVTGEKGIPDNNKNNVLRKWRHRWKKTGKETALVYQQVAKCMEIGLRCQEIDPSKRPFIWDMIHDIREMERANGKFSDACGYTFGQISPYSEDDMLGVEPLELHFPFEINKQISCSFKLTNQTDAYIAFNIQNMSPLPYRMHPNKGIVLPQSKCNVDVTLHRQDKALWDMQRADEFIVWSTKVNGLSAEDITINMFNNKSGVVDAMNLDVVFHTEESTIVSKELILHSITEDMPNIKIDGTVGDVKKSQEYLLPTPFWMSGTGSHNHREAEKESSEIHEASEKTSEEKVQQSQYQIIPWQTELPNKTSLPVQLPNSPLGKSLTSYPHVESPMSSPVQGRGDWGILANKNRQVIQSEVPSRNIDHDYRGGAYISSRMEINTNGAHSSGWKACGPLTDYCIPDYILKPDSDQVIPDNAPCCPVVVFINSRSGGQLGSGLIKTYRELLNEAQVFDLSEESPDKVLHRLYVNFERLKSNGDTLAVEIERKLRLIVAGGDGTASWLLGVVSDLKLSHSPPVATVPLGTGNNLPFSFGWGKKNPATDQEAVKSFLGLVKGAREMSIDSWHIIMRMRAPEEGSCDPIAPLELPHSLHAFHRVSGSDSLNVEGYHTFRGGFWNYFSMGMDAQVSYGFHSERKKNPEKFKNQLSNQGTYAKLKQGWFAPSLTNPSSRNIAQLAKVKIMKRPGSGWEELKIPSSIRSIICLNLPSFSGGFNPWGTPGTRKKQDRDLTAPYVDDGLIEVVGFRDAWHGLVLLSSKGHGTRLAQAHRIRFEFHKGAADHTFMRVDGEPWKQPLPTDDETVVVEISHLRQVTMLANDPCKSKSVDDPMSPSSRGNDNDDSDSLEDEDEWKEGRKKFGAADTFKLPDEVDIAHLS